MRVAITGADGFIGKNLVAALRRSERFEAIPLTRSTDTAALGSMLSGVDAVVHLAGANRPADPADFEAVNVSLTSRILSHLARQGRAVPVLFASSTQATLDNPYGRSKLAAESALQEYAEATGSAVYVLRLPNVYGKWCRPNYNSAVATFCHNIARDLPIEVSDSGRKVTLIYIDDVVAAILARLATEQAAPGFQYVRLERTHKISLGDLVALLRSFRASRQTLELPDLSTWFTRSLYATYVSYIPEDNWAYQLKQSTDSRGALAELLKSDSAGQLFFSTTRPGITRGNHVHDTKVEKFCVLKGEARIRFRHVLGDAVIQYDVSGDQPTVVDIPPGYTHSIENVGADDMVVLFWASETFQPSAPDTFSCPVLV